MSKAGSIKIRSLIMLIPLLNYKSYFLKICQLFNKIFKQRKVTFKPLLARIHSHKNYLFYKIK